jgi:DNA-binding transcriptional LysR family regulator
MDCDNIRHSRDEYQMNLRSIDLNLLLVFEALLEERSVTRAARRVGLSQPALSNALGRLRRTFGDPLLARSADGLRPTPRGEALAGPVRAALASLRAAIEGPPQFDPRAAQRTFHLLANDYVEILLLAKLSREVSAEAGEVGLRVSRVRALFEAPRPEELADTYDLALGFFPAAPALTSSLQSELLWEDRHVVIARLGHPNLRGGVTAREYAAARHAAVFYKGQGPGLIDALLAPEGLSRHPAALVPHFASVPFIVAATDLIATVPERLVARFSSLKLQVFPPPLTIPSFRLAMLWHERYTADPAHLWLRRQTAATAARINQEWCEGHKRTRGARSR